MFLFPLFTTLFNNNSNDASTTFMIFEEERKREANEKFKKDFEEYFQNQLKQIPYQITPDLFQIEPFYTEETLNLINLITEKEKYEGILFNEVKKILSENAKKK